MFCGGTGGVFFLGGAMSAPNEGENGGLKTAFFLVDFGNIPCPDPVLRLRARGKVRDPCFCNEAYVQNKSGKNTP